MTLCERLWPALQAVDSSSGALGTAVWLTLDKLLPLLVQAPADTATRRKWIDRLYSAVQDDGVDYLFQVRRIWGIICKEPDLIREWADRLLELVSSLSSLSGKFIYSPDNIMCFSCLLEAGRYNELQSLLKSASHRHWSEQYYWAEALRRQGKIEEAISFAEDCRSPLGYDDTAITCFCERLLIEEGHWEQAYKQYGRFLRVGHTYLNQYRAIVKKYPQLETRRILQDLIDDSDNPGNWFAAAGSAGHMDIAYTCALNGTLNPGTLITAAYQNRFDAPEFSFAVALRAMDLLLEGYGYEIEWATLVRAVDALRDAAAALGKPAVSVKFIQNLALRIANNNDFPATQIRQLLMSDWPDISW
ncbi:MAG: hypothetical protein V2A78_01375 [bacterium]